jgi:alanine racemase
VIESTPRPQLAQQGAAHDTAHGTAHVGRSPTPDFTQPAETMASMSADVAPHAEIMVDLAAIRHNVRTLREVVSNQPIRRSTRVTDGRSTGSADEGSTSRGMLAQGGASRDCEVMVVVKADAYGHGMIPCARAAREAGASWLGVAMLDEALSLRAGGDRGRILSWLAVPGENYAAALAHGIDITAYTLAELEEIRSASRKAGVAARLQLKVDTGLSRGGSTESLWPTLVAAAARAQDAGEVIVTGVWSHLAASDEPDHVANTAQEAHFRRALGVVERAGLQPEVRHLANSAAALLRPSVRFDLVRCGIAAYGLDPAPAVPNTVANRLTPAMTVRTRLAQTKSIPAGAGVSYGHTWTAPRPTTVGLVPMGYAEGVPRHASSRAEVWVAGKRRPVRGRICMDQFVVDLGGDDVTAGAEVVVMGPGLDGEPTAQDWAEACGTINYEIVTRWGGRLRRTYVDSDSSQQDNPRRDPLLDRADLSALTASGQGASGHEMTQP